MNPRTVFHLLLTDIRRLRWLILITPPGAACGGFIPWAVSNPWGLPRFRAVAPSLCRSGPWSNPPRPGSRCSSLPDGGAGGSLWMVWPAEARVRRCGGGRSSRKLLLLLLLLWLPQAASLLLVLRVSGLSWPDTWLSSAACAGVFVPLWSLALATGRLTGSLWRGPGFIGLLAALAAFAGLWSPRYAAALGEMLSDAWGANCGPVMWGFTWVTAAALWLLLALRAAR